MSSAYRRSSPGDPSVTEVVGPEAEPGCVQRQRPHLVVEVAAAKVSAV
jgi:hypothetical protein